MNIGNVHTFRTPQKLANIYLSGQFHGALNRWKENAIDRHLDALNHCKSAQPNGQ